MLECGQVVTDAGMHNSKIIEHWWALFARLNLEGWSMGFSMISFVGLWWKSVITMCLNKWMNLLRMVRLRAMNESKRIHVLNYLFESELLGRRMFSKCAFSPLSLLITVLSLSLSHVLFLDVAHTSVWLFVSVSGCCCISFFLFLFFSQCKASLRAHNLILFDARQGEPCNMSLWFWWISRRYDYFSRLLTKDLLCQARFVDQHNIFIAILALEGWGQVL